MAAVEPARHEEVGERLSDAYRRLEAWDKLAKVLADGAARADHEGNTTASIARLREAAALMRDRCDDAVSAMVLLEEASGLAPDDQAIRLELADAMRCAGRFDDARPIFTALLDAYGGRRPRERAAVHHALARLEVAQQRPAEALRELETASRIDPQNAAILQALAALAHDTGQIEQAERSYRALLALLRRLEDGGQSVGVARSEAFLELSAIAGKQGDAPRAKELLESALEAAAQSPFERERLERALRARGDTATLARLSA
jgi:tetratricopeptide (TPR) repeat protein